MSASELRQLSWFNEKLNLRLDYDLEELRRLRDSLVKKQLVPLICGENGTIYDGHRRYRAAMIDGRPAQLETIILKGDVTDAQVKQLQLVTSIHRTDLKPIEVYGGFVEILKLNPGKGNKFLAEAVDKSEAYVSMILSLSKCIKIVQDAAKAKQISLNDWYAISQLPPDQQEAALMAKLQGGSVTEFKRAARRNGSQPTVKMPKIKIPLANDSATGLVVVSGENIDLDDTETLLKEALKAVRAAKDKNLDCRTAQSVWRDMAGA